MPLTQDFDSFIYIKRKKWTFSNSSCDSHEIIENAAVPCESV